MRLVDSCRARRAALSMRVLAAGASALAMSLAGAASAQDAPPAQPTENSPSTQSPTADQASPGTATPNGTASGSTSITANTTPKETTVDSGSKQVSADGSEIVVTGIRQSLAGAQAIKRNADTVVDAISAEDIGALPDRSINEALQRVPGVAISRFAAPSDSQHFSAQGSGVTIRGIDGFDKSEFNGRDTFAISAGRGIGYNDVPSELAGSVEVYKNLTADMIEGGISGTVSINTRKPFDQKGQVIYLSGAANYGDLDKKWGPQVVGLYSNTFDTAGGSRFGILAGGSYQRIYQQADSVFTTSFLPRFNAPDDGVDGYAPNGTDYQGTQYDGVLCDGNNPNEGRVINAGKPYAIRVCDAFPTPAGKDTVYTPTGAGIRTQQFNITRKSLEGALQFENADRSLLVTANYLRADYTEKWLEHTIENTTYYGDIGNTYPAGYLNADGSINTNGTSDYTFDDNGVFTSGTIAHRGNNQAHNTVTSCVIPNNGFPYTSNYCPYTNFVNPKGLPTDFSNRSFYTFSRTQDMSLNVKFDPTSRLHLNLDGQYVVASAKNVDDINDIDTFTNTKIDLTGKTPQVQFLTPGFNTADYFLDPNTHFFNDSFNNRAINNGREYAIRGDAQFDISDNGFFRALRAGGRWSKRSQTVRTNDYNNWGNLSQTWTDSGPAYFSKVPDATQAYVFQDFFRGKENVAPPVSLYLKDSILRDHDALEDVLRRARDTTNCGQFQPSYTPLEDRNKPTACGGAPQYNGDLIDGYFEPQEIYHNSEETYAGYMRLDFGTQEFGGGMKLSGNIGVRYVHSEDDSTGAINFPQQTSVLPAPYTSFAPYCAFIADQNSHAMPGTSTTTPALCQPGVTAAEQQAALAFANGGTEPQVAKNKFHNWLPALNIRLDLTSKLLVRFAASEAMTRPNFGDLRNFVSLSFDGTGGVFTARSANPYLKPITAKQLDLTAEWYFAKVGSLTGAVFYKDLKDVILTNQPITRTFSNNGVDYTLGLQGPGNAPGHTKVKGAEVAYQQTYDFLPGFLSGFGTQATLTYIKPGTVVVPPPNYSAPAVAFTGNGQQPPLDITGLYDNIPLPGLSKWNANAQIFYSKFGLDLRVAYSWRSKFLLTAQDCCFPFLPVYANPYGQADASAFYTINKHVKLGIEASNILDATTKTRFLLNGDGLTAPRSYFKTDRQYTASVRMTF